MPKFRRKPLVVEAVKITSPITIDTAEGIMTGKTGDYLITHQDGTQYPCDRDTFEKTYEPILSYDVKKYMVKALRLLKRKLITGD